ncbi:winged helix-turn-helix domain-containing protein [Aliiglaciecola sp. M165]|uniref:winged helix-turn-helix domain-containing protein n=1 Tax=Aliiglaciecola sp. M165 TaxID=2593649 RepID=UPI00117C4CB7|nr:winged helix-turn-helix domain-containing protein [Aliiglaciecola sp. M165]TRY31745.1 transcriptional regulator [Aliiglaciecola sp. M165]
MAKQYWLGEFFVDLSRNQISQHTQSQTLPPKALSVLTHLAENRGRVVSYDELLDKVWPNTVVTPNTLQRSIAQLRKALGENSKTQGIIKTHAKQGYSIECDVNWSDSARAVAAENDNVAQTEEMSADIGDIPPQQDVSYSVSQQTVKTTLDNKKTHSAYVWPMIIVALLIASFALFRSQNTASDLKLRELNYLTATDNKEYGAAYSPNGEYVLFHRYFDKVCMNNIWAKNASTLEEYQLTNERGTYADQNLSPDGKRLTYIKEEDCTKPITQNTCYKLMSLDFEQALLEPQTAEVLLHCQNSAIRKPIWLDNQHIAMMQREDQYWRLIRYSTENKSSSNLYQIEGGHVFNYAWSAQRQLFAVNTVKNDGEHHIDILYADGSVKSSHPIKFPDNSPRLLKLHFQFVPNTEHLVLNYAGQLFSLSENGEVGSVDFPFDTNIGGASFHPDGSRVLLIKGRYDNDVARLVLPKLLENEANHLESLTGKTLEVSVFERSIDSEYIAKFQPNENSIAMASGRTGSEQIWMFGDHPAKIMSNFPRGFYIRNMLWDPQGTELLVLADMGLHLLHPNGDKTRIDFSHMVTDVFHWDAESQSVTANIRVNGLRKLVNIDLNTRDYQRINDKGVQWAAQSQSGALIFVDQMHRFWQRGGIEDTLIEPLLEQGSSKRFVIENDVIYGINRDNQLWSFDLKTDSLTVLGFVSPDIDYITDIRDGELLVTLVASEKKEVIELSVAN